MGRTSNSVGKATTQDSAQDTGQIWMNAALGPSAFRVEMPETTKVISTDRKKGITTAA